MAASVLSGGYLYRQFMSRVKHALQKLEDSSHDSNVVVTHGQFIRAAIWLILTGRDEMDRSAMKEFYAFLQAVPFPNAAFVTIRFEGSQKHVSGISWGCMPA